MRTSKASKLSLALLTTTLFTGFNVSATDWPVAGFDMNNTRHNTEENILSKNNVGKLNLKWAYETGAPGSGLTDVRGVPVIVDNHLYVGDQEGFIHAVNTDTGQPINNNWPLDLSEVTKQFDIENNRPVKPMERVRTVTIYNNWILVGDAKLYGTAATEACYVGQDPDTDDCSPRTGGQVAAINRLTGKVIWKTVVEPFYATRIQTPPVVYDGIAYVGVSGAEELSARSAVRASIVEHPPTAEDLNSPYPCCGHKGSIVAMNVNNGEILWKTYLAPLDEEPAANSPQRKPDPNLPAIPILNYKVYEPKDIPKDYTGDENDDNDLIDYSPGFSGSSAWGTSIVIDPTRGPNGRLVIGTGNGYMAPDDYIACQHYEVDPQLFNNTPPKFSASYAQQLSTYLGRNVDDCGDTSLKEMNRAFGFHFNSILALNLKNGKIEKSHAFRDYDLWTFVCSVPETGLGSIIDFRSKAAPSDEIFLGHGSNVRGCPNFYEGKATPDNRLTGLDAALAHQPFLVEHPKKGGLVGGADKDGIFVVLDADTFKPLPAYKGNISDRLTGKPLDGINIAPGGVLGGIHFSGIATDGKSVYLANANWTNGGRDITAIFIPSPFDPFRAYEDPSNDEMFTNSFNSVDTNFERNLDSGPPEIHKLVNPPSDVVVDGVGHLVLKSDTDANGDTITGCAIAKFKFSKGITKDAPPQVVKLKKVHKDCRHIANKGDIITLSGSYTAIDLVSGKFKWQRPTPPVLKGLAANMPTPGQADFPDLAAGMPSDHRGRGIVHGGGVTLANGVIYSSIMDQQGSMIAIDAKTGKLLRHCHAKYDGQIGGDITSTPTVLNGVAYYATGEPYECTPFCRANGIGNRIYAFHIGPAMKNSKSEVFCRKLDDDDSSSSLSDGQSDDSSS